VARQVTAGALLAALAVGCWRLSVQLSFWSSQWQYSVPGLVLLVGAWLCYRLVNYPKFADFLIAVEAEMAKVSWPSRRELIRATVVVLVSMLVLTVVLYLFDSIWTLLLDKILNIYNKVPT